MREISRIFFRQYFIGLTFTNYTETNHKEIEFEKKASTDFHCRVFPFNRNSFYWIYVLIIKYRQFIDSLRDQRRLMWP